MSILTCDIDDLTCSFTRWWTLWAVSSWTLPLRSSTRYGLATSPFVWYASCPPPLTLWECSKRDVLSACHHHQHSGAATCSTGVSIQGDLEEAAVQPVICVHACAVGCLIEHFPSRYGTPSPCLHLPLIHSPAAAAAVTLTYAQTPLRLPVW